MCGIAGVIDKNIVGKEKVIGDMVTALFHRGPDQDGFYMDDYVGLGMRRLSIIDLSSGKQPIWSHDRKRCIFFNGEIYNYLELREELIKKGVTFTTHSDTEVILHMYEEYGAAMLPRLRGMFTFCIYDIETKHIFIARDFFGIKPLYYLTRGKQIVAFSSEIKSFLSFPGFLPQVNDAAVYNYLSYQYNPLPETFFDSVYKLPPAHFLEIDLTSGQTKIEKYWSFEFPPAQERNGGGNTEMTGYTKHSEDQMAEEIRETVENSVAHHMIADVPVGAFLSGGVDSSIIATLMQKIRGDKKIKTFTIGWDTLTEGVEARQTSDFLGSDHTEIKINPDEYFNILPKAVWHFDEPVGDPSAIGLYFVAREARKHVTVVLSGEGADELFGGYNIYLEPFARRRLAWVPRPILNFFIHLPFTFRGQNYMRRALEQVEDGYIGNASVFKKDEVNKLWKGTSQKTVSLKPLYEHVADQTDSTKMQYIDVHTWLVGDILAKADKMTMANSLELRVPFLDTEVARLAVTLPDTFKWRNGATKYLLRKAFTKVIPESTRNRKKLGFPTPIRDWLTASRHDVYNTIRENKYIQSHIHMDYVETLIANHISKKADNSRKIYVLLMLALWYDVFIEKKK